MILVLFSLFDKLNTFSQNRKIREERVRIYNSAGSFLRYEDGKLVFNRSGRCSAVQTFLYIHILFV